MTQILLEYIAAYLAFVAVFLLFIRGVGAQERECEVEYD